MHCCTRGNLFAPFLLHGVCSKKGFLGFSFCDESSVPVRYVSALLKENSTQTISSLFSNCVLWHQRLVCGNEFLSARMLGPPKDSFGLAFFYNFTAFHHNNPVCNVSYNTQVVTNKDKRQAKFLLKLQYKIHRLRTNGRV